MSVLARELEPELLDTLGPDDRRARRARLELHLVNAAMGNASILARALRGKLSHHDPLLDLGGGDGRLALALAKRLHRELRHVHLVLLDRHPCMTASTQRAFQRLDWHVETVSADAATWLSETQCRFAAVTANLFLHHFDGAALEALLARAARRTPLFIACEPRRSPLALMGSHLVAALGASAVTRHDAIASVRAGFAGKELSAAWPDVPGWRLTERPAGLFSHSLVAEREAP